MVEAAGGRGLPFLDKDSSMSAVQALKFLAQQLDEASILLAFASFCS